MKRKPRVGDIVAVKIHDHVHNSEDDEPIEVVVYGRVARIRPDSIAIDSWAHEDPETKRVPGNEIETFTLVWSAVLDVTRLVPEE